MQVQLMNQTWILGASRQSPTFIWLQKVILLSVMKLRVSMRLPLIQNGTLLIYY